MWPQLTSWPVSSTHSLAHCFLASISTLNMVQTDSGTLKSVDLLAFCILESNADFVLWDKKKKEDFYAWNLSFGRFSGQKWVTFVLVEVFNDWRCISVSIYWVIFCIRSIKRASCGRCVWHKNKDIKKERAIWIQTDVEVLIQLWWPLSLTSWRRPPSCRWPSVWVSAPDVWRTRAPASGGPARTSAEHPASRTNPRRWPSRYCREDEERD